MRNGYCHWDFIVEVWVEIWHLTRMWGPLSSCCVWMLTVQETWLRHFSPTRDVLTSEAPVASEITLKMLWSLNLQWQSCHIELERCSRSHVIWLAVQLPSTLGWLALLIKLRDRYENKWWGCKALSVFPSVRISLNVYWMHGHFCLADICGWIKTEP